MIKDAGPLTVAVPGTPVQAASLLNAVLPLVPANTPQPCHAVMFQALPGNTGKIYIGRQTLNRSTGAGVFGFLAIPTTSHIPSFSTAITIAPNALNLNDYWIDADVANDGVIVTVLLV